MDLSIRINSIAAAIFLVALTFASRLYYIQVLSPSYKDEAKSNILERIREYPRRGLIFDRTGKLLVANENIYDITVVPREFELEDTVAFCNLFKISKEQLIEKFAKAKNFSHFKESPLIGELRSEEFAEIQDRLSEFPGLNYQVRTTRRYQEAVMANVLGYVKEISRESLHRKKSDNLDYEAGDPIGRSGIEASYEELLRGRPGSRYVMLNVKRIEKGSFMEGKFDTLTQIGADLTTGIDLELQKYAEMLMRGKIGAAVAIEPSTGQILSILSAPDYDPELLTGRGKKVDRNYGMLLNNEYKPLFNRAVMSLYPPGSTIKTVQALVALHHGVADGETRIPCVQNIVKCHGHMSPLDISRSIQYSCNPFYVQMFRKIVTNNGKNATNEQVRTGLQNWHNTFAKFGLGIKMNTDLFGEKSGLIPVPDYYDKFGREWGMSNLYSLGIGQGEMGCTPLQMANVAAIIANRGWYYAPHIARAVDGDSLKIPARFLEKQQTGIDPKWYEMVIEGMANVHRGTASRAFIDKDLPVCGKTGTAQNPHGEDHSVFIAFAPRENPKIAVAVYVENAGFGGSWAAPIASLMIEKYIRKEIKRKHLEEYVLRRDFIREAEAKKRPKPLKLENNDLVKNTEEGQKNKEKPASKPLPKSTEESTSAVVFRKSED